MSIIPVFETLSLSISSIRNFVDTFSIMYPGGVPFLVQRAWYRHHLARLRAAPRLPAGRPLHPPGAIFRYLYLRYLRHIYRCGYATGGSSWTQTWAPRGRLRTSTAAQTTTPFRTVTVHRNIK